MVGWAGLGLGRLQSPRRGLGGGGGVHDSQVWGRGCSLLEAFRLAEGLAVGTSCQPAAHRWPLRVLSLTSWRGHPRGIVAGFQE